MLHIQYRPKTFEEVVGHSEIVKSIKSFFNQKEIPHSFLFSGTSGCGKTSFARIMGNMLEAEIVEVNIANTGGVDFIRELNTKVNYSPLIGKNKVFILDEVQQLTKEGQNCLLKMLEDFSKYSYFILCTTDLNKLILPIRNRCNIYTFKPLSDKEITNLVTKVAKMENIALSEDILNLIVYKSEGIPRSALVYLNQVRDIKNFDEASLILSSDIVEEKEVIDLCRILVKNPKAKWGEVVDLFTKISIEPEQIRIIVAGYLSACLKKSPCEKYASMLQLFLSPLTFGSQKSELIYLLYKAWVL